MHSKQDQEGHPCATLSSREWDPFLTDPYQLDLDIHILQSASQNVTMTFDGELFLHQWNELPLE